MDTSTPEEHQRELDSLPSEPHQSQPDSGPSKPTAPPASLNSIIPEGLLEALSLEIPATTSNPAPKRQFVEVRQCSTVEERTIAQVDEIVAQYRYPVGLCCLFVGKFVFRTSALVFRFAKKFAHNERTQLTRASVTYLHSFTDPSCTENELRVLTVHAVMQPVLSFYGQNEDQQYFQLSLEPFLGSTLRVLHRVPRLLVEGL